MMFASASLFVAGCGQPVARTPQAAEPTAPQKSEPRPLPSKPTIETTPAIATTNKPSTPPTGDASTAQTSRDPESARIAADPIAYLQKAAEAAARFRNIECDS